MTFNAKEAAEKRFVRSLFGRDTLDQSVYIISGAPGSGKTTYVQKHKRPGDLIVDLDLLAAAFQGEDRPHPEYATVMDTVLAAREAAYQVIESRTGMWKNAYVITSSPDRSAVNALKDRLGAKVIPMNVSLEDCVSRIRADTTRTNPEKDISLAKQHFDLSK